MTRNLLLALLLIAVAAGLAGYFIGHNVHSAPEAEEHEGGEGAKPEDRAVASVQVVPIRKATLTPTIDAFGAVIAEPGEVKVLSVQFESRVTHVGVISGQTVEPEMVLVEIEPSPDTVLLLNEAERSTKAATADLDQVQKRFDARLATNQDLFLARQNLESAKLKEKSLRGRGAGAPQQLKSESGGIVSKISVQEGQIIPAGGGLIEVAPADRIEVRIGLEASEANLVNQGAVVKLHLADSADSNAINGKIRLITRKVNFDTRAIDAYVSIPKDAGLPLDAFVSAEIHGEPKSVLAVPRAAVIPGEKEQTLFTIVDGKAVEHHVSTGIRSEGLVEVIAGDLKEGDSVVVSGGAELESGMRVVATSTPAPATRTSEEGNDDAASPASRPSTPETAP